MRNINTNSIGKHGASNTDARFKGLIISFVVVTSWNNILPHTFCNIITNETDPAFANVSIIEFIRATRLTSIQNIEVSRVTSALTISLEAIDTTVLISTAFSTNQTEATVTNATLSLLAVVTEQGAVVLGSTETVIIGDFSILAYASTIQKDLI